MTNTMAQGQSLMKSAREDTRNGGSWNGWCASWVYRFVNGDPGNGLSAETAALAYAASGPRISTGHADAPKGAIGWWSDGSGPGHVAVALGGDVWGMASGAVTTEWGTDSGTTTWTHYHSARPDMVWTGWTADYCGSIIKDAVILLKRDGHPEIYKVTGERELRHLPPSEYFPLKAAGHKYVIVSTATLEKFTSIIEY